MKAAITLTVDTNTLSSIDDSRLHALWHVAQMNPAPLGDRGACDLVADLTAEIVRRWLAQAPTERYTHQPTHHHWHTLHQHGNWRGEGGAWLPYSADAAGPGTAHNTNTERA